MDTLERFNAALTYIEANLDNEIDSKELSKITLYSAYQFQKLFMAMSGIPLSEYIRNRRLDKAAFDLQNTDEKIADIAVTIRQRLLIAPFRSYTVLRRARYGLKKAYN